MTDLAEVTKRALEVLDHHPAALITDIDGTLSHIVLNPEDATVSELIRQTLRSLAARLDLVAVITGREESVARAMVGVEGLTYVGNYALSPAHTTPEANAGMLAAKQAAALLLPDHPCVTYEDKGIGFSMHYRHCDEPDVARRWLLDSLTPIAISHGGRLVEGKRVVEMVPAMLPAKDEALRRLAEEHGLDGIIFLGDDTSDVAIFEELGRRRKQGFASLSVGVVDTETHSRVLEAVDVTLDGVDSVEAFLGQLDRALAAASLR